MSAESKAMEALGGMNENRGDVYKEYLNFTKSIKTQSSLDNKTQELILVSCAMMSQCDMCVALHVQEAATLGATKEEIIDAALLSIAMGGSPKIMYMKYVFEAVDDLFG